MAKGNVRLDVYNSCLNNDDEVWRLENPSVK